jgi:hypothetical protein
MNGFETQGTIFYAKVVVSFVPSSLFHCCGAVLLLVGFGSAVCPCFFLSGVCGGRVSGAWFCVAVLMV